MAAFVNDLKTLPRWQYRAYTVEETAALANWLSSTQCAKEMIMTDNLWENMKRLSTRVGIHTHPVFEYPEQYMKIAQKDVGTGSPSSSSKPETLQSKNMEQAKPSQALRCSLPLEQ